MLNKVWRKPLKSNTKAFDTFFAHLRYGYNKSNFVNAQNVVVKVNAQ